MSVSRQSTRVASLVTSLISVLVSTGLGVVGKSFVISSVVLVTVVPCVISV